MTLKARVLVQVVCSECHEHYELALGLQSAVQLARGELDGAPLPAPEGWVADGGGALCPTHVPEGTRRIPTPAVLKRAAALQALAQDPTTSENERQSAWARLGDLWKRYDLPVDLGL